MEMKIKKLPWMTDDEFNDFVVAVDKFYEWNCKFAKDTMMKSFTKDQAIAHVYNSNKLENTLPVGVTYSSVSKFLKDEVKKEHKIG